MRTCDEASSTTGSPRSQNVRRATRFAIPQVGTTTFRPNYTPVTFGTVAGLELGDAFEREGI